MPSHIRKDDDVIITAGNYRGQVGKVLSIDHKNSRVVVKGPGIKGQVKTLKPTRLQPQGGQVEIDRSFHISNVSPVVGGKPSRVRFETKADGSKARVAARDGSVLSTLVSAERAKKKHASGRPAAAGKTRAAAAPKPAKASAGAASKPKAPKAPKSTSKKSAAGA